MRFFEEVSFRSALLGPLREAVDQRQAVLLTAAFFGIAHYYGLPGVVMAGFLGWFLGKSMTETKGLFWPWFIHFLQDVIVFSFMAIGAVAPGGVGAFRMALRKVVILDGTGSADRDLAPALDVLTGVMELNAHEVQTFTLRILKLGCCIGCFGCWLETPGICIQHNGVSDVAQAIIRSDMIVLFTPVTFGGYSSELKRMLDRFIQFALPYFGRYHGETHHLPRYSRFPRLVAVGVQRHPNPDEAGVFKGIVGRNAINLHTPSHAAEIVLSSDDSATLRRPLQLLLERVDPLPLGQALRSFTPAPPTPGAGRALGGTQRALVIVGSPKTNSLSTSRLLGGWLLNQPKEGRVGG